jgi:hypothetical protein
MLDMNSIIQKEILLLHELKRNIVKNTLNYKKVRNSQLTQQLLKIKAILVANNKLLENKSLLENKNQMINKNLLRDNNKNLRLVLDKVKNHNLLRAHSRSQNHSLLRNSLNSSILQQVVVHS